MPWAPWACAAQYTRRKSIIEMVLECYVCCVIWVHSSFVHALLGLNGKKAGAQHHCTNAPMHNTARKTATARVWRRKLQSHFNLHSAKGTFDSYDIPHLPCIFHSPQTAQSRISWNDRHDVRYLLHAKWQQDSRLYVKPRESLPTQTHRCTDALQCRASVSFYHVPFRFGLSVIRNRV